MNQTAAYKVQSISTMPRGRLVVLLYEGAINALTQAILEMEAGHIQEKAQRISKATDIIEELRLSLNVDKGGEVASNLLKLYDFMILHLTRAHLQNDPKMIREVITMLRDLNEAWKTITT